MDLKASAARNFETRLKANDYPGRGMVIGLNAPGTRFVQLYWIMGRSAQSQNRRFVQEGDVIRTAPVDASKVTHPELIIYNAIARTGHSHIVSNGDQTDTIFRALQMGSTFEAALATRTHELDAPNFTPRISGLLQYDGPHSAFWLAIIKPSPLDESGSVHQFFRYTRFAPGYGMCLHTYQQNGDPVPAFVGEPYPVPLPASICQIADTFYDALNPEYRISVLVKTIDVMTEKTEFHLINKHQ